MQTDIMRRVTAEFFGTFWLTFGGCGAAVLAAAFPSLGIGFLGVSLAFGLTVLTMAYAVGHISGGHFNPGRHRWPVVGGTLCKPACPTLHHRPGDRRRCSRRDVVVHRFRQGGLGCWGLRIERLRRTQPRQVQPRSLLCYRGPADLLLHLHHRRYDLERCRRRLCRHSDRFSSDIDPPDLYPCHQYLRQSGAQHRPRSVRGRGVYRLSFGCFGLRR